MSATTEGSDANYEHWPAEAEEKAAAGRAMPIAGYDSLNGYRRQFYQPAHNLAEDLKAVDGSVSSTSDLPAAAPGLQRTIPYYSGQPHAHYTYPVWNYPFVPGPVLYAPVPWASRWQPSLPQPVHTYQATRTTSTYLGRTEREVELDNMTIAAREGAYAKRKVCPINVKNEQLMWVVELDGTHTLRMFSTIRDLEGDWLEDPRFSDSFYFVRQESAKDDQGKKE